jgi:hypothetical protein
MQKLTLTAAHKNFRSIDFVKLLREYFGWGLVKANHVALKALAGQSVELIVRDDQAADFLKRFEEFGGKQISPPALFHPPGETPEEKANSLRMLTDALSNLALPAKEQLALQDFGCIPDELILDVDQQGEYILTRDDLFDLTTEQRTSLQILWEAQKEMGEGDFTEEAVRASPRWQSLRELASAALKNF